MKLGQDGGAQLSGGSEVLRLQQPGQNSYSNESTTLARDARGEQETNMIGIGAKICSPLDHPAGGLKA